MARVWGTSALLATLFFSLAVSAAEISGRASVIDGDTIEIAGKRIRLFGIDAPEARQSCTRDQKAWRCGQESAWALANLLEHHLVLCDERGRDRYARIVAVCYLGGRQGTDVNARMVQQGWALAYRQYSMDYISQENEAQAAKRGMWSGAFQAPWDWRQSKRQ